jgi:hypothetical protein
VIDRVTASVRDVLTNGAIEEEDFLLNHRKQAAKTGQPDITYINAVEKNSSGGRIVKSGDKIGEGCFSRAAGPNQGDN